MAINNRLERVFIRLQGKTRLRLATVPGFLPTFSDGLRKICTTRSSGTNRVAREPTPMRHLGKVTFLELPPPHELTVVDSTE